MSNLWASFQFDRTAYPKKHCRIWICFFAQFHHLRILRQKSREDSNLQEFFPKTSNPTQKKTHPKNPTMFFACQVFWKIVQRYAKLSYKMSRRKRLPRRCEHCTGADQGMFDGSRMLKFQSAQTRGVCPLYQNLRKDAKADIHCELKFTKKTASIGDTNCWSGGSGITNLPIYFFGIQYLREKNVIFLSENALTVPWFWQFLFHASSICRQSGFVQRQQKLCFRAIDIDIV